MPPMSHEHVGAIGYDAEAYARRENGYSPEDIRNAVWKIAGAGASGIVLDVGSGEGGWVRRLKENTSIERITSVDIIDVGAGRLDGVIFHLVDVSCAPLPCGTSTLDWIFALEVIEHLANPRHFIAEACRSLKEAGKLVVSTPCNDSITARLSFLFRGYFPAFCEHDYKVSGHITPMTEIDLRRIATETGFKQIEFYYPLPGRMPKSRINWQSVLPRLHGKLWSDTLFAILIK